MFPPPRAHTIGGMHQNIMENSLAELWFAEVDTEGAIFMLVVVLIILVLIPVAVIGVGEDPL